MFRAWGKLPNETGTQPPSGIFYIVNSLADEKTGTVPRGPEELAREVRTLYGM
jgi:hypothetical protein